MSTIIKFELKELRKLANDKNSCVIEKKVTQNLALQPWCLGNVKESITNLIDYKIGKFDKKFNGILLSYKNLRVHNVGSIRNDNPEIHFPVQADYFIFRPHVGATLKGVVNKKSITHLGVLVHRVFNVVIPRPTEEPGNEWIGSNIKEGQEVVFQIVELDLYGALPYIRGKLDERMLVGIVDTIFADVAQPDQARIVSLNAQHYLKNGGHFVLSIKASCIDSTAQPEAVFAAEVKKLQAEKLKPQEQLTLEPYERDHAVVVGVFRPPPKNA